MKDLSVIIISYNTRAITKKCLDTVVSSLKNDSNIISEIIVLDNASTDGSAEMLQKYRLNVAHISYRYIISNKNLGFSKGNNRASKMAQGTIMLLLNSDIEVQGRAIVEMYCFFTSRNNVYDFIGGKLLEKNLTPQPSCGPMYTLGTAFVALFLGGDRLHITRYSPNRTCNVDWVSGACIMTKKSIYHSLGGFDEKIFMYMDEIDLFLRAKKKGYSIGFYPHARFIHLGSASSNSRKQPILQVYKGYLYLYDKHFSLLAIKILILLLQLKAYLALAIGKITRNRYLVSTYEEALNIIAKNR